VSVIINKTKFFDDIRTLFGDSLSQSQVDGCNVILDAWVKWRPGSDERWIAYSLATTFHETARTMQPIREEGEGRGHGYGLPAGPWHNVYYGRGDVQLTWDANYAETSHRLKLLGILGPDDDLVKTPDLALRPDIAAAILIFGMMQGWFTGKRLGEYFDAESDWVNARRIINGTDCAEEIAGYGETFFKALSS
jgi:putative chitinase